MDDIRDFHWSVTGSSHLARKKNCEDASLSYSARDFVIASCADGHGARYCFRSGKGAKMAVETAWRSLQMLMQEEVKTGDLLETLENPGSRQQLFQKISSLIVHNWHRNVSKDLDKHPLTFMEQLEALSLPLHPAEENGLLYYGTTLLFAAMNSEVLLLGQQGDGRICVLYGDGTMNMPVGWDKRCAQNVTTSLCDDDAAASMRFSWINLKEKPVAAVFLVSDGIEDSFDTFAQMYEYLLELTTGFYRNRMDFERYLANSLSALSVQGSLDDASIAGFFNRSVLQKIDVQIERKVRFRMHQKKLNEIRSQLSLLEEKMAQCTEPEELGSLSRLYNLGIDAYTAIREEMKDIVEQTEQEAA